MNVKIPDFLTTSQAPEFNFSYEAQEQAEPNELERFYATIGNWSEFGIYFGIGLSSCFAIRLLPWLVSAGVILSVGVGVALVLLMISSTHTKERLTYQLILLAFLIALIGGNWDAWTAWIDNYKERFLWAIAGLFLIWVVARRAK